ncbi:MAG: bifunctional precorrin-2 dehydrogenase/sirohydrochlorin ferrochelatase [Treponema sp.]|nr:bifunctional precorrin-2 dehydrogenase/sirohydrochlorin ferrochelatase [Treponema sp.]
MPYFPLFVDLTGKDCLIVGGGTVAARKAQSLLDFGAQLRVVAPEPSEFIKTLSLTLLARPYQGPKDLVGATLVIAATDEEELNRTVAQDAQAVGIPVNVVDDPEMCTFFFPALVHRGELVTGISTSGSCPRFSALFREHLDATLPPNLGAALESLRIERRRLHGAERISYLDSLIVPLLSGIFTPMQQSGNYRQIPPCTLPKDLI